MISSAKFNAALCERKITFFTGVPDSLLKSFCAYISNTLPSENHLIAANEGNAIGIAVGYHLATGNTPVVYMQNSGFGNAVNPLLSLADPDVYRIPMLLLIGWRGKPGVHDEPQHVKQGRVMLPMLDAMEIPYFHLGNDNDAMSDAVNNAIVKAQELEGPVALIVEKNAFEPEAMEIPSSAYEMTREDVVQIISRKIAVSAAVVSTTGMTSRELFESRAATDGDHSKDFLTVGGMGHASQIALGIALQQVDRPVVCIDGDGAAIMHLGGMGVVAKESPSNFIHILLNNGAHASVGGQPTIGFDIDFVSMASSSGYKHAQLVTTREGLKKALSSSETNQGPVFIEVRIRQGHRRDLGRPTRTPTENKADFTAFLDTSL